MNFYKLAMGKLPEIQAAMDETRKASKAFKSGPDVEYAVILHKDGRVETVQCVAGDFIGPVFRGDAEMVESYLRGRAQHYGARTAKGAVEAAAENWV